MDTVRVTRFAISDVPPARQPLSEILYPHAVTRLLGTPTFGAGFADLDARISACEHILPELRKELAEPLPFWMEDGRKMGYPEEADAEVARRQARITETEDQLARLRLLRAKLAEATAREFEAAPYRIEGCSRYHGRLVANVKFHPLIAALHHAFQDHRPITLSPDMVWLLIAHGVAHHINANADSLRSRFVAHEGKIKLIVRRDDFVKGSPENPWAEVFPAFTDQVRDHVGEATHDFFVARFSTTGPVEKAAFEITLMDAMQSYFSYELHTMCGIPEITLEGTPDDWATVRDRARRLRDFDLAWWQRVLDPILEGFVAASEGRVDRDFWQSIYKYQSFSGGNAVTGWITAFFPYLKDRHTGLPTEKNPWLSRGGKGLGMLLYPANEKDRWGHRNGPAIDSFPSGLARAPVLWRYLEREFDMEFLGGFVGVAQDTESRSLRPEIGWAIREVRD